MITRFSQVFSGIKLDWSFMPQNEKIIEILYVELVLCTIFQNFMCSYISSHICCDPNETSFSNPYSFYSLTSKTEKKLLKKCKVYILWVIEAGILLWSAPQGLWGVQGGVGGSCRTPGVPQKRGGPPKVFTLFFGAKLQKFKICLIFRQFFRGFRPNTPPPWRVGDPPESKTTLGWSFSMFFCIVW